MQVAGIYRGLCKVLGGPCKDYTTNLVQVSSEKLISLFMPARIVPSLAIGLLFLFFSVFSLLRKLEYSGRDVDISVNNTKAGLAQVSRVGELEGEDCPGIASSVSDFGCQDQFVLKAAEAVRLGNVGCARDCF